MTNLNFPIKKGDTVTINTGLTAKIIKYSSNKEIYLEKIEEHHPQIIISKEDIIKVNGEEVKQLSKKIEVEKNKTIITQKMIDGDALKAKLTSKGWGVVGLNNEILEEHGYYKTCFSFCQYLKEKEIKIVNSGILPDEYQFVNVTMKGISFVE